MNKMHISESHKHSKHLKFDWCNGKRKKYKVVKAKNNFKSKSPEQKMVCVKKKIVVVVPALI